MKPLVVVTVPEKLLQFSRSFTAGTVDSAAVSFGVDLLGAPVYLNARVVPGTTFAKFMLTLGKVVAMQDTSVQKDNSVYQNWVYGEYLKELSPQLAKNMEELPGLLAKEKSLDAKYRQLWEKARNVWSSMNLHQPRQEYFKWLYDYARSVWLKLDPIVSVQPDATFFEAFSTDESTYVRVTLPHSALDTKDTPICGTTNIDFSLALEREFARARSYRDLSLTVGSKSVSVDLGVSSVQEKKIDLPMSWVKGLVEVQAALSLESVHLELSSSFVADLIARLQSQIEKHGPRHLLFILEPGLPVRVRVEPWGEEYIDLDSKYEGSERREIKFWGRRRIRVLENLLPLVEKVSVRLIDSGMPSFWSASHDGVKIDIGLSGWTSQNWAGRAKFSALMPTASANSPQTEQASNHLREQSKLSVAGLAGLLNVSSLESQALLQRLCLAGVALYDADDAEYRWRQLFPEINFDDDSASSREERFGLSIYKSNQVAASFEPGQDSSTIVKAEVEVENKSFTVQITIDIDGRATRAQCDCNFFNYNKLRLGPCRHIVATSLVERHA